MGSANINRERGSMYSTFRSSTRRSSAWLLQILILALVFLLIPAQSFATSGIAAQVAAACAPMPTVPDVGSCSACHSTTNNRGPNDLTAAGQWSLSSSTFNLFCPTATTPPTPTPPPATPPPATPPPGSPATPEPSPTPGMGGSGAPDDDDDDDDRGESDDDDDDDRAAGSLSSRISEFRARLRALFLSR